MNFQTQHLATLSKYAGISFIAGAVNHGMFSEQRSLLTAAVGVCFYLIGAYLEKRSASLGEKSWGDLLGFGIVASIGLGFFTGGLQHFPDSPERSSWVVPLGFFLSVVALYFLEGKGKISKLAIAQYASVTGIVVVAGSLAAAAYLKNHGADGHAHDHSPATSSPNAVASNEIAPRIVVIEMNDSMRFAPGDWQAKEGERLRLIVVNKGKVKHELVLGQTQELADHAAEMKKTAPGHHHHTNAIAVEPGQAAELLWTFSRAGTWGMACYEPGHYEAGMKGVVEVAAKGG
jgi:uncharacterized cupredoxin-like copper-binding protein